MEIAPRYTELDKLEDTVTEMIARIYREVGEYIRADLDRIISQGREAQKTEAEITDEIMAVLRERIKDFDEQKVTKIESIDNSFYSFVSGDPGISRRKSIPFSVAMGAIVLFAYAESLKLASEGLYDNVSPALNKRILQFRKGLMGIDRKADLFRYVNANVANIPPKIALKQVVEKSASPAPFKISVNSKIARRFTNFNSQAGHWLAQRERYLKSVRGMTETARDNLNTALAQGYVKGERAEEITARVDSALSGYEKTPYYNARTIAKTEISGAANFGEYEFIEELVKKQGVKVRKQWIQRQRATKRKTHAEVHLKTIRFEEKFIVDGEEMKRPHDENASAKNVVNCDCRLQFFYDDDGKGYVVEGDQHDDVARNVIKTIEQETEDTPESVGLAIEKIGDFVEVDDAIDYIKDIAGITVQGNWTLEELNSFSDIMDRLPMYGELINSPVTQVKVVGERLTRRVGNERILVAGYHELETQSIFFSRPNIQELARIANFGSYRESFIYTGLHELAHAYHYTNADAFKKFAEFSFIMTNTEGNLFVGSNWTRKAGHSGDQYFVSEYASANPYDDWAESFVFLAKGGRDIENYLQKYFKGTILYRKIMFLKGYFNL